MNYCKCHGVLTIKQAIIGLKDEVVEFVQEPSRDELSDIAYCVNRLAGAITNRPYLSLMPFTRLHTSKIEERMKDYGCIRSKRHLINGKCPSEGV